MSTPSDPEDVPYVPIACGFHDVLLDRATRRRRCEIRYRDAAGEPRTAHGRIVDVYARAGAEFLRLDTGDVIRLDRLLRVDDLPAPGVADAGP